MLRGAALHLPLIFRFREHSAMDRTAPYTFLVDTYATERIKTLSVWCHFGDEDLGFRPEPRARTPVERMVLQWVSVEPGM